MTSYGIRSDHRADDRRAPVIYRTSFERRDRLKSLAAERGVSVQTYLDAVIWGEPIGEDRRPGRQSREQQELPLTG